MDRQGGQSDPSQKDGSQGQTESEGSMQATSEPQRLQAFESARADENIHDLSYLAGPPYAASGQSGEPKRYFQGLAENASVLGISKADLLRSEAESPFHSIASATENHSNLPVSLQPTTIQHRYPHHPFWDCIPIPDFRNRAILAGAAATPLINRFEVCWDLFAGGLTYNGDSTMESSWTFSGDFREKWKDLFNMDLKNLQSLADQR